MYSILALLGWVPFIRLLNGKASLLPQSVRHWIHWLHAITFEALLFLAAIFLRPLGYLTNQKNFIGPATGRPILLVHGYLHDSSAWIYMKRELAARGFGPIYTINLIHPFRSIAGYSALVGKKAEQIASQTGRSDLVLIGHSMGGLVSSWYATQLASPGTVTDVITIGSPLRGTHVAEIALGPNGREMRIDSPFVQSLQKAIAQNEETKFYHIGTKTDQLVIPSSSAWLGDCLERQFAVDDLGHITLLFSPRIVEQISQWLN